MSSSVLVSPVLSVRVDTASSCVHVCLCVCTWPCGLGIMMDKVLFFFKFNIIGYVKHFVLHFLYEKCFLNKD